MTPFGRVVRPVLLFLPQKAFLPHEANVLAAFVMVKLDPMPVDKAQQRPHFGEPHEGTALVVGRIMSLETL